MKYTILLLEDDTALAMGIEYALSSEGYDVVRLSTYEEGMNWLGKCLINEVKINNVAALFDVMLSDGNGFDLLKEFRTHNIDIPVIFLTAVSDEINVVQGLELGADDYIAKPFRVKELMSRLKAVLRRYNIPNSKVNDGMITYYDLSIDVNTARVQKILVAIIMIISILPLANTSYFYILSKIREWFYQET